MSNADVAAKPDRNVIFDVGAHTGEDSEFYLKKGFVVVAIEAMPQHVEALEQRFAGYIAANKYFIEAVAIGDQPGPGDFYVHPTKTDWHTAVPEDWRGEFQRITVRYERFANILKRHPAPYYVKIDIEGHDRYVIDDLTPDTRPPYLSFEMGPGWEGWLERLAELGYTEGQIVDQSKHRKLRAPEPAREGAFVDARFTGHMSGLFGRELDEDMWKPFFRTIARGHKLRFDNGQWYDIHVR